MLNFEKKIVMITLSKLKSVAIEQGQRILKVMQYGAKTANEDDDEEEDEDEDDDLFLNRSSICETCLILDRAQR